MIKVLSGFQWPRFKNINQEWVRGQHEFCVRRGHNIIAVQTIVSNKNSFSYIFLIFGSQACATSLLVL